ncbi:hypothetical protein [Spectribacter hydrogenoxidans]|uniref:Chorismatase FkbO/Hyg5-like N-terminal domain-containing protein n=1 Tax=Spectribacter hydrogenoxidans TaxID=3075608 RepID=A0ABU3BWD2_9GAMM|nr:hypothetical protein [Salinisphaera sp. W335]MDT0633600.1 hypothetical protein [Salinisphaera sp. W335]
MWSVPAGGDSEPVPHRPLPEERIAPRLAGHPVIDWRIADPHIKGETAGWSYAANESVCLATLSITTPDANAADLARHVYRQLLDLREALGFPHLLRVWHYLSDINAGEGDAERYKRFCQGRLEVLQDHPSLLDRMPAATVVGSQLPGLHLQCLLTRTPPQPLENPRQVRAYEYPRRYGPSRPAFARAARMAWPGAADQLFISGTASILGHETRHPGDVAAQLSESLANVATLLETAGEPFAGRGLTTLEHLIVYLRDPGDIDTVETVLADRLPPGLAWTCRQAELCRRDLLVEVEALATA